MNKYYLYFFGGEIMAGQFVCLIKEGGTDR